MSTRCQVFVKDNNKNPTALLYHHWDGYPEGVGKELVKIFKQYKKISTPHGDARWFLDMLPRAYEDADCIHGDLEYLYVVDLCSGEISYREVKYKNQKIKVSRKFILRRADDKEIESKISR